jgi:hypothetical protein
MRRLVLHALFNAIEAGIWLLLAIVIARRTWRKAGRTRNIGTAAAAAFAAFAVSDLVEIHTGAWYRPWWLLAWKAACLAMLAACYIQFRRQSN